jgi:hypothetical protein
VIEIIDQLSINYTSIFVFNANNPITWCINEQSFEIVLTLFLHELIILFHRNFNCRFDHVPGLAPL